MHVVLVPFGSHGDVHPFVGLGQGLRARGHRVTFAVSEYFGPLVRGLGFDVEGLGDAELFRQSLRDPDLWHPRRGFEAVARFVVEHARWAYPVLERLAGEGDCVLVGGTMALVVRVAQERLGVPSATVHLQPAVLHSDFATPVYPGPPIPRRLPRWLRRSLFDLGFALRIEPAIAPGLNAYRAELGLPPVRNVMRRWMHSPQLVLGLFPEWFGPPQPDWPPNVVLTGFPLYDERDTTPLPPDLIAFLDTGPPPLAFTPGSANLFGRPFFEAAADACARLGRRGVMLTRHAEQVPDDLPDGVIHVPFAPFSLLLPRVAALVHHGGIGTASQGLAAGVPQLVMPLGHDQFDNADRMRRLGVARSLLPARFRGAEVAAILRDLTGSPAVAASCRAVADLIAADPRPLDRACEAIEALGAGSPVTA